MKNFIAELKRRKVSKTALAYLAAAWFLIEVADTIFPRLGFDDSAVTVVIILFAIGLIPVLVVSWIFEITPDGIKRDNEVEQEPVYSRQVSRTADRLMIIFLLAAVALFAIDKFVLDPARDNAKLEQATDAARSDALFSSYRDKSIAVLAFRDLSPEQNQEYFSDGIAEELLNLLSTVKELRVISRSSAFSFKGSNATVPEIAEKLNVSYVVEGSVRKSGDSIRITALLIDAKTDKQIWSKQYDRTLKDIFAIQDEISAQIVDQLKISLLSKGPTSVKINEHSYEKYLKAMFIINTASEAHFREAQRLLNEALSESPDYVPALNALGRLYYRIPKTEGLSAEENYREIQAVAARVMEIEPEGISALIWKGWFAFEKRDMRGAAQYYEKALAIDPNNSSLLRVLVLFLVQIDRADDAVKLGEYLLLRDPACAPCINNLTTALRATGNQSESVEVWQSLLNWHSPTAGYYWSLGVGWLLAGQAEKALTAFEQESLEGNKEMGVIMALHDLGNNREFEQRFEQYRNGNADNESIARIYAWTENKDKAFEWLNKMVAEDGPNTLSRIDTDLYDKIKGDPRWKKLRRDNGFLDIEPDPIEFKLSLPINPKTN